MDENHIAFRCRLVPSSLGSVVPVSDAARGLAACEVTLHPPHSGAAGSNEETVVEVRLLRPSPPPFFAEAQPLSHALTSD